MNAIANDLKVATAGPASEDEVIISSAILDEFRALRNGKVALRSTAAVRAMVAFSTIRLPYPRQLEAMMTFLEAQELASATKGNKQNLICLFAPPHTGKTIGAEHYAEIANAGAKEGRKPVVLFSFENGGGAHDLHRAILKALGEGFPGTKDLFVLRDRSCEAMRDAGTELLMIDEIHEGNQSITSEIKTLLNWGHVGIVLLGTEDAERMINKAEELSVRSMAPCTLGALDWSDDEDRALWIAFLEALDKEMLRLNIISEETGLGDEELALALCIACGGVIGQVMKVVLHALRGAIHDHRDFIAIEDLAVAVDDWSVQLGLTDTNPIDALI